MARLNVHADTPSESIVRASNAITTVADGQGRRIGIKKIGALDRMKMFEAIGPENSKNEAYLGYAALAFSVAAIDEDGIARPVNKLQLEALIQRLGDDGLEAIGKHFQDQAGAEETPIKNGQGTPI